MAPLSDAVLILNPVAAGRRVATIRRQAGQRGFAVRTTTGPGDAATLATAACRDGASLVIAAGGDGTVNGVVNGIAAADAFESATLAIVPAGSANVFAAALGIRSVDAAFDVMDEGRTRRFDLARLGADGRYVLSSVLGGPVAVATRNTTRRAKRTLGRYAYLAAMLRETLRYAPLPVKITTTADASPDCRCLWQGAAAFVLVANARRAPERLGVSIDPCDGALDLVILAHPSPAELAGGVRAVIRGDGPSWLIHHRVPRLRLAVDGDPRPFSVDGETIERAGIEMRTCPGRLRLRTPATTDGGH